MITTALLIGISIPLVSIIAGLLIARCMSIADDDADDDARADQIIEASRPAPLTMDEAYMRREVRRVRGLS